MRKILKTEGYPHALDCNRARGYSMPLNENNILAEKSIHHSAGCWSQDTLEWFYKPPLYVITYQHTTHPYPGELRVDRWDENGKTILIRIVNPDYYNPEELPSELKPYRETIERWIRKWKPKLWERSQKLLAYLEGV